MSTETMSTNGTTYGAQLASEGVSIATTGHDKEREQARKIAFALAKHSKGWSTAEEFGEAVEDYIAAGLHLVLTYPPEWPDPQGKLAKAPVFAAHCLTEEERDHSRWKNPDTGKRLNGMDLASAEPIELRGMVLNFQRAAASERDLGRGDVLPNLAVHIGKSGLVILDADTPATVQALDKALKAGDPDEYAQFDGSPTVRTPGKIDMDGNQVHKDGGHHYLIAVDNSVVKGKVEVPGTGESWSILTGNAYVLLPGSRRKEGRYVAAPDAHVGIVGPWLTAASGKKSKSLHATGASYTPSTEGETPRDRWEAAHTWHDILTGQGWKPKGTSSCGDDCRVWEHPTASSARSATAHGTGCTEFDADPHSGSYPLHMWSGSHPQIASDTTISKAQFVCTTVYGDHWAQFFKGEDVDSYGQDILDAERAEAEKLLSPINSPAPKAETPLQPASATQTNETVTVENGAPAAGQSLVHAGIDGEIVDPPTPPATPEDALIAETLAKYPAVDLVALMATPPPPPDWLEEGLFAKGGYYGITAAAKAGKSLLAYWMVGHWALGRSALDETRTFEPLRVVYLDYENSAAWLHTQLTNMGFPPAISANLHVVRLPSLPDLNTPQGGTELIKLVAAYRPDVIVFDTVSRTVSGDENSAQLWSDFYKHSIMPIKRALPDAVIIRLDHTGKDEAKGARGSSQKMSDIDTHWVLTAEESNRNALTLTRERSRMDSHVEVKRLSRVDTPALGHVSRNGRNGLPSFADAAAEAAEAEDINSALDELEAPNNISNNKARLLLRDNDESFSNERLSLALKYRKDRPGKGVIEQQADDTNP